MKFTKFFSIVMVGLFTFAILAGCAAGVDSGEQVVNVYSARHYDIDRTVYEEFTKQTGIKVNVIEGSPSELLERMKREGADTSADIFIASDMANLYQAIDADLTQPIISDTINANVGEGLIDQDKMWLALTRRARVIAYDKETIDPSTLKNIEDLADSKYKGKVLIRSSLSTYNQSLMASWVAEYGEAKAIEIGNGFVANFARDPQGNDRDQVKAVAAGQGEIAVLYTYYLGRMANSDDPEEKKAFESVGVFMPESTHMNITGAVMNKYSTNQDNSLKLLEFMTDEYVQGLYTNQNYEYPVNPKVEFAPVLQTFGEFNPQNVNLTDLGKYNRKATEIFGIIGWK